MLVQWRLERWVVGGGRGIRASTSVLYSGSRSPLITFPQRKDSNGQPLVRLSLEHMQPAPSSSSASLSTRPAASQHSVTLTSLPIAFGRLPLTSPEMEAINVSNIAYSSG
ncbi:hypothetical protein GBAR_LOCUS13239 [Geodia barretti]|uniref:Uncharacterized protein n=1 Tax=Geodia barretti TaxID=519541 RepID=A0AA35WMQ6_GEOBA|nr:hypothetical protein GBAR_LOCUS13239 [Geodia barretti]